VITRPATRHATISHDTLRALRTARASRYGNSEGARSRLLLPRQLARRNSMHSQVTTTGTTRGCGFPARHRLAILYRLCACACACLFIFVQKGQRGSIFRLCMRERELPIFLEFYFHGGSPKMACADFVPSPSEGWAVDRRVTLRVLPPSRSFAMKTLDREIAMGDPPYRQMRSDSHATIPDARVGGRATESGNSAFWENV